MLHFRSKKLCNILDQYKSIVIYGTGDFAQQIYPQLVQEGLKKKIICFTQSEKSMIASIDEIPIIEIAALHNNRMECVVLIAVSKLYEEKIKQTLLKYGYPNIVSLADYCLHYQRLEEDFRYLTSFEEYCEYIADWYVKNHVGNLDIKAVVQELLIKRKQMEGKKDSNLIVMICGHLSPRTIKIAGALVKKKYKVILLSYVLGTNLWCLEEFQKINVPIYTCQSIAEMLYYSLQNYPLIYFFEPVWGDCLWVEIMLQLKEYFGNIVLALYDILNDGYVGMAKNKLASEKFALEHADGIIWRGFSKEYLEKKGFKFQGKSIQFLDCCCRYKRRAHFNSDFSVIKLCMIHGYGDEVVENRKYETKYADLAKIGEILKKIGNRQDCELHFFVGSLKLENIERCKKYEKQYKNFKFFHNVEYSELLRNLQKYDYGCDLYIEGEMPPDDVAIGDYYGSLFRNSIRNVYFDFLDAGLPIITTQSPRMWEYLSAYDIVIKMDLSNIDIGYLKQNKSYYATEVDAARKVLDIDNQISRLIHFFKTI